MMRYFDKNRQKRLINTEYDCCGKIKNQSINQIKKQYEPCCPHHNDPVESTADIIVVGSGMAGTMAMLAAVREGASVIMLEAEASLGGTTLQSGGTIWVPNLTKTREIATVIKATGIPLIEGGYNNLPEGFDIKGPALEYMASSVYPELYNNEFQYLGMPADIYHLLEAFYDKTSGMIEDEILPYINELREEYNEITSSNQYPLIYDPNLHALASGFTLTHDANQVYNAVADPVIPNTFGQIVGYSYSVTDTPGHLSLEPNYYDKTVKPGAYIGRQFLFKENENGIFKDLSYGGQYIKRLWDYLTIVKKQQILTGRRVIDVAEKSHGIIVTAVSTSTKTTMVYKANKAVIFGSGGFSHNNDLIMKHLMFSQVYGTCSSNGCRGDLVEIAEDNRWELTQMKQAFWNQRTLNDIGTSTPAIQWFHWFSSMMVINKFGNRVYSETAKYNERAKVQFAWDATRSYYNQYLFMVIDRKEYNQQRATTFMGSKSFSVLDNNMPIENKIRIMTTEIKNWFQSLPNLSEFVIDDNEMAEGFINSINLYHQYCSTGLDEDFQRQNNDSGRHWLAFGRFVGGEIMHKATQITVNTSSGPPFYLQARDWRFNEVQVEQLYGPVGRAYFNTIAKYPYTYPDGRTLNICPDITMQPIIDPVVVVLVPTTLDTKGGPLYNKDFKIAYSRGSYVAGNAGGNSFTGQAYFGAGGTLGPAIFSGWTAGKDAAHNDYINSQDQLFGEKLNVVNFMNNDYPDRTIALDLSDPVNFIMVIEKNITNFKVLVKLSGSINENIPYNTNSLYYDDWETFEQNVIENTGQYLIENTGQTDNVLFYKVVLPSFTFPKSGNYLVSFQLVDLQNISFGPAYADQVQISVLEFNNINNYYYIDDPIPNGSLLLEQIGGFWTGKNRVDTTTGFPEVKNGNDIYVKYHQPSHNLNLNYAFQFNTLEEVINFANIVYVNHPGAALDAGRLPPGSPSPVVNLNFGITQPWFITHYGVLNNDHIFPKNEVSNFAYISTDEVTKNWFFNTAYTESGKYTAYFYYCSPHRDTSIHIGWFVVLP